MFLKNRYKSPVLLHWSKAIETNGSGGRMNQNVIGDKVSHRLYRRTLYDRRVSNIRRNWLLTGGQIKFLITAAFSNIVCLSNNCLDVVRSKNCSVAILFFCTLTMKIENFGSIRSLCLEHGLLRFSSSRIISIRLHTSWNLQGMIFTVR